MAPTLIFLVEILVSASENEEEDDNEFYDALAEGGGTPNQHGDDLFTLNIRTGHRRNSSDSSSETEETRETKQVSRNVPARWWLIRVLVAGGGGDR